MPTPPPETEDDTIVVTGRVGQMEPQIGGFVLSRWVNWAVYIPSLAPDPLTEEGGNDLPQVATFEMIDGNVIVRLPGYDFALKLPATDWANMTRDQRGAFIKMMTEFRESPRLVEALDHLAQHHVTEVVIRYDDVIHTASGGTNAWAQGQTGYISYYAEPGTRGVDIGDGTKVVISINPALNHSARDFAITLAHELRHPVVSGIDIDEGPVEHDAEQIWSDIFNTPNSNERSIQDYLDSMTFIGSMHGDNATGTSAGDTLSGLSGNDVLNGAAGDDLVLGGAGMDRLSGGTGTNLVMGGLDADIYAPAAGVDMEELADTGGVDRIDLGRFSLGDATLSRYENTLVIELPGATVETIHITDQWLEANRIEQFTFSNGTFAATYIEFLAMGGSPSGGGSTYGMPVVLDLDGDGLELIEAFASKARFDVDGDGRWERIGWVGADDGILALDRNGNGRIDDFSEISFVDDFLGAGTDLEGLYAYDTDGDGFLTAADDRFLEFLVWKDENGNGRSEKMELFSLDELGIVSIGLERRNVAPLDRDADANQIVGTSTFETANGRTGVVGDLALFVEIRHSSGLEDDLKPLSFEGYFMT